MELISELAVRDGIPIEKGIVLSQDFLTQNQQLVQQYLNHWMLFPDLFLDMIAPTEDKYFKLKPYQRIELRAIMRYRYNSWTNL